jgi:hypothetical protein
MFIADSSNQHVNMVVEFASLEIPAFFTTVHMAVAPSAVSRMANSSRHN